MAWAFLSGQRDCTTLEIFHGFGVIAVCAQLLALLVDAVAEARGIVAAAGVAGVGVLEPGEEAEEVVGEHGWWFLMGFVIFGTTFEP